MKKVESNEAKELKNSDTSKLLEYSIELKDKDIDFCINTIMGRYPEKGYCTNEKCKEICYVLEGNGTINKKEEKIVNESMDVTQGKLVIGLDINIDKEEDKYVVLMYNNILGGSATSKMFQNIREKEHLAYVANSMYFRHKNVIFINCGIEIENYEKTLNLTKQQLQDMKKGNFTDEDISNSKKGIIATIKGIEDEQDTMITYCFGQELSQTQVTLEKYKEIVENINKKQIVDIANKVDINTVYFLKN